MAQNDINDIKIKNKSYSYSTIKYFLMDFLVEADYLRKRDAEVLLLRLDGKTLKEIADIFDLSTERIRQLEARGVRRLNYVFASWRSV